MYGLSETFWPACVGKRSLKLELTKAGTDV